MLGMSKLMRRQRQEKEISLEVTLNLLKRTFLTVPLELAVVNPFASSLV